MPNDQQLDDDIDDDEVDPNADPTTLVRDLRKQLRSAKKELRQAAGDRAELATLKQERVLNSDDLKGLNEKQRAALVKAHEGEFTVDALKQTAADLGWLPDPDAEIDGELDQQETVTAAAAASTRSAATGLVKPDDVGDWSTEKVIRFKQQHPNEFEALKRGETVKVAAFA